MIPAPPGALVTTTGPPGAPSPAPIFKESENRP
jgi:hypothetical protein